MKGDLYGATNFLIFFNSSIEPLLAQDNERLANQINDLDGRSPIIKTSDREQYVKGCKAIEENKCFGYFGKLYYWNPKPKQQGGKKRRSTKKRKSKRSHKRGRHTKRVR